jgi:BMFP domain-containing protein YqiC
MIDAKIFDDIAQKVGNALPPGVKNIRVELEKNIKAALQASFAKLNLVTREEFDLQAKLLAKSREQLVALEKRLAELETK